MCSKTLSIQPTEQDVEQLKIALAEAKRKHEYDTLKQELQTITYRSANLPNDLEGALQQPDIEQRLQTKRKRHTITELLLERLVHMLSPRPIINNMIALGITMIVMFFLSTLSVTHLVMSHQHTTIASLTSIILTFLVKHRHIVETVFLLLAAIQVIKSGTRSLLLPLITTIAGVLIATSLAAHQTLFGYSAVFYNDVMYTGIAGLALSVLSIS